MAFGKRGRNSFFLSLLWSRWVLGVLQPPLQKVEALCGSGALEFVKLLCPEILRLGLSFIRHVRSCSRGLRKAAVIIEPCRQERNCCCRPWVPISRLNLLDLSF